MLYDFWQPSEIDIYSVSVQCVRQLVLEILTLATCALHSAGIVSVLLVFRTWVVGGARSTTNTSKRQLYL